MNGEIFWFVARASGITAYLLISASMIAGIVLKSRPFGAALKAPIALDVHRFITTLALAAIKRTLDRRTSATSREGRTKLEPAQ